MGIADPQLAMPKLYFNIIQNRTKYYKITCFNGCTILNKSNRYVSIESKIIQKLLL